MAAAMVMNVLYTLGPRLPKKENRKPPDNTPVFALLIQSDQTTLNIICSSALFPNISYMIGIYTFFPTTAFSGQC